MALLGEQPNQSELINMTQKKDLQIIFRRAGKTRIAFGRKARALLGSLLRRDIDWSRLAPRFHLWRTGLYLLLQLRVLAGNYNDRGTRTPLQPCCVIGGVKRQSGRTCMRQQTRISLPREDDARNTNGALEQQAAHLLSRDSHSRSALILISRQSELGNEMQIASCLHKRNGTRRLQTFAESFQR